MPTVPSREFHSGHTSDFTVKQQLVLNVINLETRGGDADQGWGCSPGVGMQPRGRALGMPKAQYHQIIK